MRPAGCGMKWWLLSNTPEHPTEKHERRASQTHGRGCLTGKRGTQDDSGVAQSSQPNFTDHVAEALAAEEALANILARFTVALIPEVGLDLGTGILVSAGAALFVATAWHVARDLPPGDVYCIPRPPAPLRIVPREEVMRRVERGEMEPSERFLLHVENRIRSRDGSDVALLGLRDRPDEFHDMDFFPLERARSTSLPHSRVLIYGFAADLTLVHRPTDRAATFPRSIAGTLGTVSDPEYNPDRDLIVTYDDPDGPIKAHGMSGGGVWLPPEPGEGLWDPGAVILTGIQVIQFPESRAPGRPLLATRIERVQALLRR
jgi:hypothetical protein